MLKSIQLTLSSSVFWREANSLADVLEIPLIIRNPKIHCLIQYSPLLFPILIQINLPHYIPSYFFNIHFNIILQSKPRSSQLSLSFKFPHLSSANISFLPSTCHMYCPPHNSYAVARIIFYEQDKSRSSSLCHFLRNSVTSDALAFESIPYSTVFNLAIFNIKF